MTDITIQPIKTDNVDIAVQESNKTLEAVKSIQVKDQASYESVTGIRVSANTKIKELDTERKSITAPIDEAKKKVMDLFRKPADILKEIVSTCDKKMVEYTDKQEKIRREQEARLQAQADKKRLELEEKARKALDEGKEAKAERYEEKAAEVIAPVLAPTVDKVKGVHFTERYYGDVIDFKILSDDYKIVDQSKLNKVIQATKGSLPIPGVRIRKERIVNTRGQA
jgi:hypothetical protein